MKKTLLVFFAVLSMTVLAVSCSKDDSGDIVGTWEVSRLFEGYYENGKQVEGVWGEASVIYGGKTLTWVFESDGTGRSYYSGEDGRTLSFTYTYDKEDKVIYFLSYNTDAGIDNIVDEDMAKVESLTGSKMVWVHEDLYDEDGIKCMDVEKVEFKKK